MDCKQMQECEKKKSEVHGEAMGFFHGERKAEMDKAVDAVWNTIKQQKLSWLQVEKLMPVLERRIKEERNMMMANLKTE